MLWKKKKKKFTTPQNISENIDSLNTDRFAVTAPPEMYAILTARYNFSKQIHLMLFPSVIHSAELVREIRQFLLLLVLPWKVHKSTVAIETAVLHT